jgi:pimeloyl-ACP methyl ester carboxylesterase
MRLFCLPGAGADPNFWRPLGERLPAEWDKTYFGWPGLGHQPPHPDVNSLDDLVKLVETQLGSGSVDLLAQSMGGLIAMILALRHPKSIRRLVLCVTSAGVHMPQFGADDWRETYRQNYPNAAGWVGDVYADLSHDLTRVTQPVLLIWGDADPISPVAVGRYLKDVLPNAELCIVKGGDHDIVHDRAADLAPLIARHLASNPTHSVSGPK